MKKNVNLLKIIATCFFAGYIPLCPGTAVSLIALIIHYFFFAQHVWLHVLLLAILFPLGVFVCERVSLRSGIQDASYLVIDEWFGMWLSVTFLPRDPQLYLIAFIIFRVLDICKPFPISYVERKIPGGLGVMFDDLVAGFFTFVIVHIVGYVIH